MSELLPFKHARWAFICVLLSAWIPMLWLTRAAFAFDDNAQLFANAAVQNLDWIAAWTNGWWAQVAGSSQTFVAGGDLYRPLTTTSLILSHAFYGDVPLGYHIENLVLHALVGIGVWRLCLAWRFSAHVSLLAAMLFASAPVAIEAVASIAQRAELLAALGAACALRWHAEGRSRLAACSLLLALCSKEGAIVVPLLAWLADRCLFDQRLDFSRGLRRYGLLMIACALYLAARYAVLGRFDLGGSERATYFRSDEWPMRAWLTQAQLFWSHILPATLIGIPLVFDWSPAAWPTASLDAPSAWIALLSLLGLLLGILLLARRHPRASFGALFFGVAYLPTSNLLLPIGVLFAPRLLYWPHLGSALLIAWGCTWLEQRCKLRPRIAVLCSGMLVAALSARTIECTRIWRSAETLYDATLAQVPNNALVRIWRAETLLKNAMDTSAAARAEAYARAAAQALDDIEVALQQDPHLLGGHADLLLRSAWGSDQLARMLHIIDDAVRQLEPAAPLPIFPSREALGAEPLESATFAALETWARTIADRFPVRGDLALLGMVATLVPDYLDARSLRQPISGLLDRRDQAPAQWDPTADALLTQSSREMRSMLERLQQRIQVLRPIADATAHTLLLDPMQARAQSWLQVLEISKRD